jgi:hypothetical protein
MSMNIAFVIRNLKTETRLETQYHHCYYLTYKGGMRKQPSTKHIIPIDRIIGKIVCATDGVR